MNDLNSVLRFSQPKKGIVFIQDYHIWLAIFETFSVEKIQTSELKQLKHLKTFSLELDRKKRCISIIIGKYRTKSIGALVKFFKTPLQSFIINKPSIITIKPSERKTIVILIL